MRTIVVDTSVFAKWLSKKNEDNVATADQILQDLRSNKIEILVPELIKYELGNVLLKGKQLTPQEAYVSLATIYSLPITFLTESEDIAKETYTIAHQANITYYDAAFLSIAKQYNAILVTENMKHQGKALGVNVVSLKDYK